MTIAVKEEKKVEFATLLELIRVVSRKIEDSTADVLQSNRFNLTGSQGIILFRMGEGEIPTITSMRNKAYLGLNVTYTLQALERRGFVETVDNVDKRSRSVRLTQRGKEARKVVGDHFKQLGVWCGSPDVTAVFNTLVVLRNTIV